MLSAPAPSVPSEDGILGLLGRHFPNTHPSLLLGRGKIVRRIPPDKAQVNFPGFGLKVILTDYLLMED